MSKEKTESISGKGCGLCEHSEMSMMWYERISVWPGREQEEGNDRQAWRSPSTIVRSLDCVLKTKGHFWRLLSKRMTLLRLCFGRSLKLLLESKLEGAKLKSEEPN